MALDKTDINNLATAMAAAVIKAMNDHEGKARVKSQRNAHRTDKKNSDIDKVMGELNKDMKSTFEQVQNALKLLDKRAIELIHAEQDILGKNTKDLQSLLAKQGKVSSAAKKLTEDTNASFLGMLENIAEMPEAVEGEKAKLLAKMKANIQKSSVFAEAEVDSMTTSFDKMFAAIKKHNEQVEKLTNDNAEDAKKRFKNLHDMIEQDASKAKDTRVKGALKTHFENAESRVNAGAAIINKSNMAPDQKDQLNVKHSNILAGLKNAKEQLDKQTKSGSAAEIKLAATNFSAAANAANEFADSITKLAVKQSIATTSSTQGIQTLQKNFKNFSKEIWESSEAFSNMQKVMGGMEKMGFWGLLLEGFKILADGAGKVWENFKAIAEMGIGGQFLNMQWAAVKAGLSVTEFGKIMTDNRDILVGMGGDVAQFGNMLGNSQDALKHFGLVGEKAAETTMSMVQASKSFGVSIVDNQKGLEDSVSKQTKLYAKMSAVTGISISALAKAAADLASSADMQETLSRISVGERQNRMMDLLQQKQILVLQGMTAEKAQALIETQNKALKSSVKDRYEAASKMMQLAGATGNGAEGAEAANILMKGTRATAEERQRLAEISANIAGASDSMMEGDLATENMIGSLKDGLGGIGGSLLEGGREQNMAKQNAIPDKRADDMLKELTTINSTLATGMQVEAIVKAVNSTGIIKAIEAVGVIALAILAQGAISKILGAIGGKLFGKGAGIAGGTAVAAEGALAAEGAVAGNVVTKGTATAAEGAVAGNVVAKGTATAAAPIAKTGEKVLKDVDVGVVAAKTAKTATGIGLKSAGKILAKMVPGISIITGLGFGIQRAVDGDAAGAIGEVASGILATIPVLGTAAAAGIQVALLAKDTHDAGLWGTKDQPTVTPTTDNQPMVTPPSPQAAAPLGSGRGYKTGSTDTADQTAETSKSAPINTKQVSQTDLLTSIAAKLDKLVSINDDGLQLARGLKPATQPSGKGTAAALS
jgi:hypothetical protein